MRTRLLVILASAVLLFLSACANPYSDLQSHLRQNEQKWAAQKIDNYQYTLRILCFCPQEITEPVVVEVRDGVTTSANTVNELFDIIRDAIAQKVSKLTVEYDPTLGYPKQITIDPIETAIDEERAYTVSDLTPLK
jgi:hypothetical protein